MKKEKIIIKAKDIKPSLGAEYTKSSFKTGRYMTEKDRPRKKKWDRSEW